MTGDAEYLKKILPLLAEEMPYKWRVQSFSKFKPEATCVAYIDARDAQQRLDDTCLYGWERDHKEIKGHVYAGVGVAMPSGRILWRWDCGVESNTEAEKGESSDSFKRAAVNWGIGRFLYDLKITRLPANEKKVQGKYPHVVDIRGKQVWDLTAHINGNKVGGKNKDSDISVDIILQFIPSCKTVKELEDYYFRNKKFITSLFDEDENKINEEFKKMKQQLTGGKK